MTESQCGGIDSQVRPYDAHFIGLFCRVLFEDARLMLMVLAVLRAFGLKVRPADAHDDDVDDVGDAGCLGVQTCGQVLVMLAAWGHFVPSTLNCCLREFVPKCTQLMLMMLAVGHLVQNTHG